MAVYNEYTSENDAKPFLDEIVVYKVSEKRGYIINEGVSVARPKGDETKSAAVEKDGRWGIIDEKGTFIIAPEYAEAYPLTLLADK